MIDIAIHAITQLIGGLGIFLLGMHMMSEGLQTVAGPSLKKIIGAFTRNRMMGVAVGAVVTAIIQSSSITTVMVVGFVNAGLMSLAQAVGIVMGANIGTTMTAWILTLKIGKWGLQVAGVSTFFYLFAKREKLKYTAMAFLGIGLVFLGLELMSQGLKPIRTVPEFQAMFAAFSADTYFGVLKTAAIGCLLTVIVQSSSATVGITIVMATQGLISFHTAAALVLGENIGTTITALLASLGVNIHAKRAAYFHSIFNVLGVLWITAIFPFYTDFVEWVMASFMGIPDLMATQVVDGSPTFMHLGVAIATVHTIFNVTNVLLFLPFAGILAKGLERFIQDKNGVQRSSILEFESLLDSPIAAVEQTTAEINMMIRNILIMMDNLKISLDNREDRSAISKQVFQTEERMDHLQEEFTTYLTRLLGKPMAQILVREVEMQLQVVDDLESISDYAVQILKLELRLQQNQVEFSTEQKQSITDLHEMITSLLQNLQAYMENHHNRSILVSIMTKGQKVTDSIREVRANHWKTLAEQHSNPLVATSFSDTLVAYRKIKEHVVTTAESISGTIV